MPTAWQSIECTGVQSGEMATRIAVHRGIRVIGIDRVDARLRRSASLGVETVELNPHAGDQARDLTAGRGPTP